MRFGRAIRVPRRLLIRCAIAAGLLALIVAAGLRFP